MNKENREEKKELKIKQNPYKIFHKSNPHGLYYKNTWPTQTDEFKNKRQRKYER